MKFLLDQNLPASLIPLLEHLGHEGLHVRDLGMGEATDAQIWAEAGRCHAVVVSKDSDYLAFAGDTGRFVRIRSGNRSNRELFAMVEHGWPGVVAALEAGERIVELRGEP